MSKTTARARLRPDAINERRKQEAREEREIMRKMAHHVCLLPGCERATVGGERLCAIHFYRLPRATRSALAIEDQFSEDRERRLLAFMLGGVPLEQVQII